MRRSVGATLSVLVLILSACDFDAVVDAVDRFDIIIQLEPIETYTVGQIIDVSTGDLLAVDATIRIAGTHRDRAVDFYGDPVESVRARGGMFSVGLQPGSVPSTSDPISIDVIVEADGFKSVRKHVVFTALGEHPVDLSLIPANAAIVGSASAELAIDGSKDFELVVAEGGSDARLAVPSGAFDGGAIQARLTMHTPRSAALPALPQAIGRSDAGGTFTILPAAFVAFEARNESAGTVRSLRSPVTVDLGIPADQTNPLTGKRYAAGDIVSVMAHDDATGRWEMVETVALNAPPAKAGTAFGARFSTGRTGLFAIGPASTECSGGSLLILRNGHRGELGLTVRTAHESGFLRRMRVPAGVSVIPLPDMPAGVALTVAFQLPDGQQHAITLPEACGTNATVALPPPRGEVADVALEVDLSCTLRLRPPFNATLKYRLASGGSVTTSAGVPEWRTDAHGRVTGGRLVLPGMLIGQRYRFTLLTPDDLAWHELDISGPEIRERINVPEGLCAR